MSERNEVIDGLRTDVLKLTDELAEVRADLIDTRNDVRHARDREAAAHATVGGGRATPW